VESFVDGKENGIDGQGYGTKRFSWTRRHGRLLFACCGKISDKEGRNIIIPNKSIDDISIYNGFRYTYISFYVFVIDRRFLQKYKKRPRFKEVFTSST
jgi:hypothetical protein